MCPRVVGVAAPRDSRQWPLSVTVTGEHTTQSFSPPSLPGSVTHQASLIPHSSLQALPDPRLPGEPGIRRSSSTLPLGSPRRKTTNVTCPGHASNF